MAISNQANIIFLFLCLISVPKNYLTTTENSVYKVTRISQSVEINGIWKKEPWLNIPALAITNYMGEPPAHKPDVRAKVAYDEKAIYVIFQVKERYVRCITKQYQGSVYEDSCVEFFFTPGPDISKGYFNLEINCIGTALFKFHNTKADTLVEISKSDFNMIEIAHSIPHQVKKEIKKTITWTIEYRLPFNILAKYVDLSYPAPGVRWKANFYKIANGSSHPHWLTWSKVDLPEPDFHRPEFFGTLKFK